MNSHPLGHTKETGIETIKKKSLNKQSAVIEDLAKRWSDNIKVWHQIAYISVVTKISCDTPFNVMLYGINT